MSLVPTQTTYELEENDQGIVVFALQKALNATALKPENKIPVDHGFGEATLKAVKRFQEKKGLLVDGVFGMASSAEMARALIPKAQTSAPDGLLRGLIEGESGNAIGAVNTSVAGGTDVSYCQRRVYSGDYNNLEVVQRAFDPLYQMRLFGNRLQERFQVYLLSVGDREFAWRLATLYHNYPYASDKLSTGDWPNSYASSPQAWVEGHGVKFTDGAPVRTPMEWCQKYSLGSTVHNDPGTMTKYVTSWI